MSIFSRIGALGKSALKPSNIFGPKMWGIGATAQSSTLLGAIGKRAIGPGLVVGGFGLIAAGRGLMGGGYSMDSPNVAWGHSPGMSEPYTQHPMTFSTANRTTQSMGATGSLAFALHNQRKG